MGAQAAEQFDRFEKVRLPDAVRADHQKPRLVQLQLQHRVVPEPLQMELVEPDGSGERSVGKVLGMERLPGRSPAAAQAVQWACSSAG